MTMSEQQRIERNVQRTVGLAALRKLRGMVDAEQAQDAARDRLLRAFLRYGWIGLLAAAALLAHYLGAI